MTRKLALFISIPLLAAVAVFFMIQPPPAKALNPNHNCDTCHDLHAAPGQSLNKNADVEVLCLTCHGAGGTSSLEADIHTNKQNSNHPAFRMTCMDCHNPHDDRQNHVGGTNIKMVGKRLDGTGNAMISTPNSGDRDVAFEHTGTGDGGDGTSLHSFADNDEDNNGIYDGTCEVCHTNSLNHRNNSGGNHDHFTGQNCMGCHGHAGGFLATGGGSCDACHSTIFTGEFNQTTHHLGGNTVTEADCAICHQEPTANHMNGNIDLKDPDTGNPLSLTIPKGAVRNPAIAPGSETWDVVQLQNNFCAKCHDSNGAQSAATPATPFSSGNPVPNIWDKFNTSNTFHHAVRGAVNNSFCNSATMVYSWQIGGTITCFDCHETTGHGSANQAMLRTSIDLDTMASTTTSSNLPAGMGITVEDFCTLCHQSSEYVVGSNNSKFEYHGANQNQHRAAGGNELGCLGCHAGIVNYGGIADNGSVRGTIHGGSYTWASSTWSSNAPTDTFIMGGWMSGWQANTSSGNDGCGGGDCNHPGSTKRNTPGKEYTQVAD